MDKITIPNGTIRVIKIKLIKPPNPNNDPKHTKTENARSCVEVKQPNQNNDPKSTKTENVRSCVELKQYNQNNDSKTTKTENVKSCVELKQPNQSTDPKTTKTESPRKVYLELKQPNQSNDPKTTKTESTRRLYVELKQLNQNNDPKTSKTEIVRSCVELKQPNQSNNPKTTETESTRRLYVKLQQLNQNNDPETTKTQNVRSCVELKQINQNNDPKSAKTENTRPPCVELRQFNQNNPETTKTENVRSCVELKQPNQNNDPKSTKTENTRPQCVELKQFNQNDTETSETENVRRSCVELKQPNQNNDPETTKTENARSCVELKQPSQNNDPKTTETENVRSWVELKQPNQNDPETTKTENARSCVELEQPNENNDPKTTETENARRSCVELIKRLVQSEELQRDVNFVRERAQIEIPAEPSPDLADEQFEILEDSIEIVEHSLPEVILVSDGDDDSSSDKPAKRQKIQDSGLPSSISSYSSVCYDWLGISDTSEDESARASAELGRRFWTRPELRVGDVYFVPTDGTHEHWVKARLVKYSSKSRLKLVTLTGHERVVKISWKLLALARRPDSCVKLGGRVIAGFPQYDDSGELVRFRGYRMGVVGEIPVAGNNFRYLIIFDNGCWAYIQPDMVKPIFRSSKRVWKQVPQRYRKEVKSFLRGKFRQDRHFERGQWVAVSSERSQLEGGQFSHVISVDCSLILVWYNETRKPEWIHKGSPRITLPSDF